MILADKEKLVEKTEGGKLQWRLIRVKRRVALNRTVYFLPPLMEMPMLKCLRCETEHYPGECDNCGRTGYEFSESSVSRIGLYCRTCMQGFIEWECLKCGTINPVSKTVYHLKSKYACFIATAVYGTPHAEEIIILKEFRDDFLVNYTLGKLFVNLYNRFSPPIADFIATRNVLRKIVKRTVIIPIITFIKKIGFKP